METLWDVLLGIWMIIGVVAGIAVLVIVAIGVLALIYKVLE